jgi:type I restriction enzyme S subunit
MTVSRRVALQDVATIERDIVEPSQIKTGTLYVGLENIESGGRFVGVRPVDSGELASSKFAFTPRHVLYGKLRPYLAKIARPDFDGICSTDILPVLPGPELDRGYLTWFLLSPAMVSLAASRATGANLPRLSPNALAEMKIPLPPLSEQRRIAVVLDKADELRVKRRSALAELDTLTRSVFVDIFGDPASNTKGWPIAKLGELITVGPQNGLYRPASDYGTGTPILRIDAFYDGVVTGLATLKRVRISNDEVTLYGLKPGEIVVNRVNSREYLGKSALIPDLAEPTVFESNMMRFDVDRERLNPVYLIHLLQTRHVRAHILRASKDAVNQSSINQQDVKSIPIPLPPPVRQELFARYVRSLQALADGLRSSGARLDDLFGSLQQRAFAGEL